MEVAAAFFTLTLSLWLVLITVSRVLGPNQWLSGNARGAVGRHESSTSHPNTTVPSCSSVSRPLRAGGQVPTLVSYLREQVLRWPHQRHRS